MTAAERVVEQLARAARRGEVVKLLCFTPAEFDELANAESGPPVLAGELGVAPTYAGVPFVIDQHRRGLDIVAVLLG